MLVFISSLKNHITLSHKGFASQNTYQFPSEIGYSKRPKNKVTIKKNYRRAFHLF